MSRFVYKSRFSLSPAEADYVCALAKLVGSSSPDDVLAAIVRIFARESAPLVSADVWSLARADGRGPWKKSRPPPGEAADRRDRL